MRMFDYVYTLYTYVCTFVCTCCCVLKRKPYRHKHTCVMANTVLQQPKGGAEEWSYRRKNLKVKVKCLKYNNLCASSVTVINVPVQAANNNVPPETIKVSSLNINYGQNYEKQKVCDALHIKSLYIFKRWLLPDSLSSSLGKTSTRD